jgi:tryptophan-rich hypothetical protein
MNRPTNRINPEKLLLSKWTAVKPVQKQRHFIVTRLLRGDDEQVTGCELEAVINKNSVEIDWQQLRDSANWLMGWK